MNFDVQTILNYYSLPLFYAVLIWFVVVGFLVQSCIVMIFTKLEFKKLYKPLLYIHAISLGVSFIGAPIGTMISCFLAELFYVTWPVGYTKIVFFISFMWIMQLVSKQFLCQMFFKKSCNKVQIALNIAMFLLFLNAFYTLQIIGLIQ